jgi:regulator of sigma E protease
MDLLYFTILIGSLIFVHELGHFLLAKAFGVKVITFCLGFGPKILRLRGRETEYCIALIPLGGYVRMLESNKTDIVMPEDRRRTFESLNLFKRMLVVLAGPVMNLVFPVLLYFTVFVSEGPLLPPTIGVVLPQHPADGKLRAGDRIMSVNGEDVGTFDEVKRIIARSPGQTLRLKVFRDNHYVEVELVVADTTEKRELDITERIGSIGIQPSAPAAVIGIADPESPAYRAGLRTFDVVTYVNGEPVRRFMDLEHIMLDNRGETVPVTYLRPVLVPNALGNLAEIAVYDAGVVALTPDPAGPDLLSRTGIELADLYAAVVPEDSYLYRAGLRAGDKVLRFDDEPVPAWSTFIERIKRAPDRPHHIDYLASRDNRVRSGTFQMRREEFIDEQGQIAKKYVLQVEHWLPLAPEDKVAHPSPIRYAAEKAIEETFDVTRLIAVAFVRLVQGRLSLDSFSGPLTIYEVAGEEGRKGANYFIWVMALLSINLGLINLLPVPVLDGGHLAFLGLEATMRRPLPLRVREIAHLIGMLLLILLMALAFKKDVERRWDVIVDQLRELTG